MLDDAIAHLKSVPLTPGAALAVNATVCSVQYDKKKRQILREFLDALRAKDPKYRSMVEASSNVPEYFPADAVIAEVFVVLSGPGNKRKKVFVLNQMLIDWISEKRNKNCNNGRSHKYPSPATINTTVRTFLAATKELYNWEFSLKDFNFEEGYNAFFKKMVVDRQKEDVSIFMYVWMSVVVVTVKLTVSLCLAYATSSVPGSQIYQLPPMLSAIVWREEQRLRACSF